MKKFAIHIGLVTVITLALMIVFDKLYNYAYISGMARSKVQFILQQNPTAYDYVFLGSSRTEFHIDCDIVQKLTGKTCINYGMVGNSFKDTNALVQLLGARGITYKNAFIQVDHSYNLLDYSPSFKAELLPYQNEPAVNDILNEYALSFASKYVPFYNYLMNDHIIGFREVFNLFIGSKPIRNFENGFVPKFGTVDFILESLPNSIIDSNRSIAAMNSYFKEHNVRSFYFMAPLCDSAVNRDLFVELLKTKIPELHDYVSLYDDKAEYFYDCGHLNIEGAEAFTRFLTNDLILNPNQ
jgi:hypothetical protein